MAMVFGKLAEPFLVPGRALQTSFHELQPLARLRTQPLRKHSSVRYFLRPFSCIQGQSVSTRRVAPTGTMLYIGGTAQELPDGQYYVDASTTISTKCQLMVETIPFHGRQVNSCTDAQNLTETEQSFGSSALVQQNQMILSLHWNKPNNKRALIQQHEEANLTSHYGRNYADWQKQSSSSDGAKQAKMPHLKLTPKK